MNTSNEIEFSARITDFVHGNRYDYYKFINLDNNTHREVPEWCILDFVILPDEVMDANGEHIKVGATIQLREKDGNKILPSYIYKRRKLKYNSNHHMNKESLYEGARLYKKCSGDELWRDFANKCSEGTLLPEQVLTALNKKREATEKEQIEYLCDILGVSLIDIGIQENAVSEYKSSFTHTANPHQNERASQYKEIYKEILSIANSHVEGCIYIGVKNNAEIVGIENELLYEVPFSNRADFVADFKNQFKIAVSNFNFISSITFSWFRTEENKLFCRINIPKWEGNVLFLNGTELYVRDEARKQKLKGDDLIDYILHNCKHTA